MVTIKSKISRFSTMRLLLALFILMTSLAKADHYYGGYITYEYIEGYTYKATVVTYADNDKVNSDRDSVEIIWGDGGVEFIQRVNNLGNGETVFPGIKKNIYEGTHTYTQPGNYQLVFADNYRPFDIFNIEGGKSGSTLLYFDAIIPIEDTLTFCKNNAPNFLTEPFMFGRVGRDFRLNLTHYDKDGDSLVFKQTKPKARNAYPVPGHFFPEGATINPRTGLFSWDDANYGNYVLAYEIEEYRNGQLIGVSVADFPVFIGFDYFEKGEFSNVQGVNNNHYHFNGTETFDLIVDYENELADSVFLEVFTELEHNNYFSISNKSRSDSTHAFDTLNVSYLGQDAGQGNHIVTFRAANIYGSDTVFDYHSVSLSTESDTSWACSIPPNIRDVIEITPTVNQFEITPNLFTESVWINLGESFENMKVQVYDMRGRLVAEESKPESGTFKMELQNLRSAMYFFIIFRNETDVVTVLKSVKK